MLARLRRRPLPETPIRYEDVELVESGLPHCQRRRICVSFSRQRRAAA